MSWFKRKHPLVATICGHETERKGEVTAFGVTITTEISLDPPEYCLACLGTMATKCAWCSLPIFVGDPVTLYSPRAEDYEVPEGASIYNIHPVTVVGCGRESCCDTGADYAGTWVPGKGGVGRVHRRLSLIELAMGGQPTGTVTTLASSREHGGGYQETKFPID